MFREGRITDADGEVLYADDQVPHDDVRVDGEPLDPPPGLVLMLHKPVGDTCSTQGPGPHRLRPAAAALPLALAGAVDGRPARSRHQRPAAVHRRRRAAAPDHLAEIEAGQGLRGHARAGPAWRRRRAVRQRHAACWNRRKTPLAPAALDVLGPRHARLTVTEGRYHQVRRMFAAVGNHVETLQRISVGGLALGKLPLGEWRALGADEDRVILRRTQASYITVTGICTGESSRSCMR